MKNVIKSLIIFLLLISCNNKLSESKVERLVDDCLTKNPKYETYNLETGKVEYLYDNQFKSYLQLQDSGFLKIEILKGKFGMYGQYYQIELTEKSKPFVIETKEYGEKNSNKIKLFNYKLDKVGSIQEIPSMNMAEVSITYKKEDKTPFCKFFEKDKSDFVETKIGLTKTENKGWIFCDN